MYKAIAAIVLTIAVAGCATVQTVHPSAVTVPQTALSVLHHDGYDDSNSIMGTESASDAGLTGEVTSIGIAADYSGNPKEMVAVFTVSGIADAGGHDSLLAKMQADYPDSAVNLDGNVLRVDALNQDG